MSHAKSKAKPEARTIWEELAHLTKPTGTPSRPLLRVLPIRRAIPQDLHALGDYANAFRVMAAGLLAKDRNARAASLVLGASSLVVSSLSDYRISVVKLIPIEAHQVFDYVWGAAAIAAPFVLGYRKRAPLTATLHILVGATHLIGSSFTDYRSARGHRTDTEPERIGTAVWR